jgi:hypothetical protein
MINRRLFLISALAMTATASQLMAASPQGTGPMIRVVRSPDCGCCGAWIAHLEQHGFIVEEVLSDDVEAEKARLGVPAHLRSCHTGVVEGYVIEGHVPADDILRLLADRPQAEGLSVPGMPIGSPGMEMGDASDAFDVVLWAGSDAEIFSTY